VKGRGAGKGKIMSDRRKERIRRGSLMMLKIGIALLFLTGFPGLALLSAQETPERKPTLSEKALTAEELAVYRVVLSAWMDNGKGRHAVHLSVETMPFLLSDMDLNCGKSLEMTEGSVGEVHRFRAEDVKFLAPSKVELVDPEAQLKEVAENDPHKNIHKGTSIGEAVANGFAHGLTRLGEIHFDKEHTHAIVAYDFSCGATCGNGSTVILEKKDGVWGIRSHCSTSVA
jgi:hypothetical protein